MWESEKVFVLKTRKKKIYFCQGNQSNSDITAQLQEDLDQLDQEYTKYTCRDRVLKEALKLQRPMTESVKLSL